MNFKVDNNENYFIITIEQNTSFVNEIGQIYASKPFIDRQINCVNPIIDCEFEFSKFDKMREKSQRNGVTAIKVISYHWPAFKSFSQIKLRVYGNQRYCGNKLSFAWNIMQTFIFGDILILYNFFDENET